MATLIIIIIVFYFMNRTSSTGGGTLAVDSYDTSVAPINLKIRNIDITGINQVVLYPNNAPSFALKTKNSIKLIRTILTEMNKSEFAPGELQNIYEYILKNYESSLPKRTFQEITDLLALFVKNWGRAILEYGYAPTQITPKSESFFIKLLKFFWWLITIWSMILGVVILGVVLFCVAIIFWGSFF